MRGADRTSNAVVIPWWFTCLDEKRIVYARDPDFCKMANRAQAQNRPDTVPMRRWWCLAAVLLKPECIIARKAMVAIHFLQRKGFTVRYASIVHLDSVLFRKLWKYSLGRYSEERVFVLEKLCQLAPAVYLLVEDLTYSPRYPAAVRLTQMKGEAEVSKRRAGELRYVLGAPQSTILSQVHSADEPADVVRELGLLFNANEQNVVMNNLAEEREVDAAAIVTNAFQRSPAFDFDTRKVIAQLRIASQKLAQHEQVEALATLDAVQRGDRNIFTRWRLLAEMLVAADAPLSELERAAVDADITPPKREIKETPFPTCEIEHWDEFIDKHGVLMGPPTI